MSACLNVVCDSSADNDTIDGAADDTARPVINDVKLVGKDQVDRSLAESRGYGTTRRLRTLRAATRLEPGRPSDDSCLAVMQSARPSSTFTHLPLSVSFTRLSFLFFCNWWLNTRRVIISIQTPLILVVTYQARRMHGCVNYNVNWVNCYLCSLLSVKIRRGIFFKP